MKPPAGRSAVGAPAQHLRRRWRNAFFLGLVLIAATALRLWGLGARSLWLDEIMTVQKASKSFTAMMREIADHDAHPPFFQIIEWLWLRLSSGDAWARMPSVFAGVAGVWLAYSIARRLMSRSAARAAAVLMAVSYFHIYYSQEARLHALVATLFLAQIWLLLRILAARGKAGWPLWAAYGAASLACLYTYALCFLTVGALAVLYLWLTWKRRRQLDKWLAVHLAVAVLFLPWAPIMHKRTSQLRRSIAIHHDAAPRPSLAEFSGGAVAWGLGFIEWKRLRAAAPYVGLVILAAAALAAGGRRSKRPAKVLGLLFILPSLGYLLLPMPRVHAYDPKHLIFIQPLLIIALSCGFGPNWRCCIRWRRAPVEILLAVVVAVNLFAPAFIVQSQKEDWRGLCRDVSTQVAAGDLLLFSPDYIGYAFEHYAPAHLEKAGANSFMQSDARVPEQYRRVWLILNHSPVARPDPRIQSLLSQQGWRPESWQRYEGHIGELRWIRLVRAASSQESAP